jgi:hypothetical protein
MSDVNLLVFGCVATSIGVAGACVYIRESFTAGAEPPPETEAQSVDAVKDDGVRLTSARSWRARLKGTEMSFRRAITIGMAVVCFSGNAVAAQIEGVRFPDTLTVGDTPLRLHGTGLLRYRMLIKGYVAALYLAESFDEEVTPTSVLADVPRRLEIEYFWAIPAAGFAQATVEGIAQNTDRETFERLRDRIERLNAMYEDVEPGDRYALAYVPEVGTELSRNGRSLGVIEGEDFSSALFSIWLGERALNDSLRRQLLASG